MLENVDLISAIITPFDDQLKINFSALERLTNHLIETGNTGLIPKLPLTSLKKFAKLTGSLPL